MSHAARLIERGRGKGALSFLAALPSGRWPAALKAERLYLNGQAHQQTGDFQRGYRSFIAAHKTLKESADGWRMAEIELRLGDMCRQQEKFPQAMRWYESVARSARQPRNHRLQRDAMCGRAMAFRGLGQYTKALAIFRHLLKAYHRSGDKEGEAYVLWAIGTTERFAGRLAEAQVHLRQAVHHYRQLRDPSGLAYAECGWGGALRMVGDTARSRELYARAFRFFRRSGDRFGIAYSSCGQGNALRMLGRREEARPFMKTAEANYRRLDLAGPLGFVLWSRAMLEVESRSWIAAKKFLAASESQFRRAGDPRGLVYVWLGKGELSRAQGRPSSNNFNEAARAAKRLGLVFEEAHARVRLGLASPAIYRRFGVSISLFSRYRSLP